MDRLELEFRMERGVSRMDLDELDRFFDHKRWLKQKEKALMRDWQREKKDLRDRTIQMIEQQVEEQSAKLKADFEAVKQNRVRTEMHANLEELRVDYSEKMAIIEEIKREKELREQ